MRRVLIALISGVITLGIAGVLGAAWVVWSYTSPGPVAAQGRATTVTLRQGAGLAEIANTLERSGVIRSGSLFAAIAQGSGRARQLKAGEYRFRSRASMAQVMGQIRLGQVVRHFVTVPEGVTSDMVIDILMRQRVLTGAAPAPPEGTVLPETYEVQRGDDRAAVLQRMMDARDRLLAQLWQQRRQGLPFNTVDEAVTLASIVEKETSLASERPRIASVFINRLRQNIPLASDPTIIYGITRGRPLGRGIRRSELLADSPYNSYRRPGLPPTPIANPGRAALAAVLDPPDTTDLYFVANGTGGHSFAGDLRTHEANVVRWRQIEREAAARRAARQTATTTTTTTTTSTTTTATTPPPPPPPPPPPSGPTRPSAR
jgi:UPF0755 protein